MYDSLVPFVEKTSCSFGIPDPDLLRFHVKFHLRHAPRRLEAKNMLVEFFVLHLRGSFPVCFYHYPHKTRMDLKKGLRRWANKAWKENQVDGGG